mgnify:CR=1 FL=1
MASKEQNKIWMQLEKISAVLGIEAPDFYITSKKTSKIFVENTAPASIIISQSLLDEFSEQEVNFILAKYLFYIAQKQTLALKLDEKELKRYFNLLCKSFVETTTPLSTDDQALIKNIKWYLPRKLTNALKERTDIWVNMTKENVETYLKLLEFASNRCALLVTESLELCVQMVYRLHILQQTGKLVKFEKIAAADMIKVDGINDLLLYNVSEEYSKLRKASNISL